MPNNAPHPSDGAKRDSRDSVVAHLDGDGKPAGNNLPLELTSLVGREKEISEVERLLAEKTRLLTLTGPGGCGKTRLALAVASDVVERYEEGVWLVELAPLSDPELMPQAVASVLDVREQPGRPLAQSLAEQLTTKKMLLVLDNCEHLVETCADLAGRLLRSCANLGILATSREALGIAGEVAWTVPPLSLPDPRYLPSAEALLRYEATRLFVERVAAVKPSFDPTPENAMAIAQVCYRLDGIPLAIELAAARAKVLSVEQISRRLDESFRLLSGSGRGALPHHRTLRAAMDWSHELLDQEERILLRRLSAFAGGWTLEAAEAVGAGEDLDGGEAVLDLLASLVDKSLVLVAMRDGETRYRLLETVRQYGREKLEESGEEDEVRRRHALYFLKLAEQAASYFQGPRQVVWLEQLEVEHDNLRAAMRCLLDASEIETAVRLAWALWFFWRSHGHQGEGYRYSCEALEKGAALPAGVRAKALCVGGIMAYGLEGTERTRQLSEESVSLFRQTEERSGLALALGLAGVAALQEGDIERATTALEECLNLYRETGDKWGASAALAHLGLIPLSSGEHERAARLFEEALALSREVGDRLIGSTSLYNLALLSQSHGDPERAATLYTEGMRLAVESGDKANAAYCLEGLAELIAERGEPERAARLFGASEALLEAAGAPRYVYGHAPALYERAVELVRSRLGDAAFGAAWAHGQEMSPGEAVEYASQQAMAPEEQASPPSSYPAGLSAREVEVLRLVANGMTNAQIAKELFISSRTVNWHLGSIYRKLGFNSRAEATRFALEHNLL